MTIGFWILPLIVTVLALRWALSDKYTKGEDNFDIFTSLPIAGLVSALAWAAYFAATRAFG